MGRMFNPENLNLPFTDTEVKRDKLYDVLEEMLSEEGRENAVTDAFFWRAVFLYNERLGIKMKEEQVEEFYKKLEPVIIGMLEEEGVKYSLKNENKTRSYGWLHDWERRSQR